jgi:hypothetical protein
MIQLSLLWSLQELLQEKALNLPHDQQNSTTFYSNQKGFLSRKKLVSNHMNKVATIPFNPT